MNNDQIMNLDGEWWLNDESQWGKKIKWWVDDDWWSNYGWSWFKWWLND